MAVRIRGPVLDGAGHANQLFRARVIGGNLFVAHRPVNVIAIPLRSLEIDITEARRGAAPEIGFPTHGITSRPHPLRARRSCIGNPVLPDALDIFVVHVAVGLRARSRIAETTELHVVGLPVIAEVFPWIEPSPRIERQHGEARLSEGLDGCTAACSRADYDDVVNFLSHVRVLQFPR